MVCAAFPSFETLYSKSFYQTEIYYNCYKGKENMSIKRFSKQTDKSFFDN